MPVSLILNYYHNCLASVFVFFMLVSASRAKQTCLITYNYHFFKEVVTNIIFCFSPLLSNHFMNTKLHIYMWASFHTLYILLFRISNVKSEQHSISSAPFVMSLNRQNIVRSLNRYNIASMKFSRNIGLLNELS